MPASPQIIFFFPADHLHFWGLIHQPPGPACYPHAPQDGGAITSTEPTHFGPNTGPTLIRGIGSLKIPQRHNAGNQV